ncbi:MFS family permease [Micromonospora luteifusca]|uniref:MFS family permease n=1 Tax=Micromonospora luteifusca TaxID=709860 RepID=A0ABS2M1M7_9ACTN|nr:MFS transporter [Micromonospora luteifusca]MBM7494330.1 MFS family permease [Micromonospora luteifusca]
MLWFGSTISSFGTAVTTVAFPIVALVNLKATTFEVSLVTAAGVTAWLLLGLSAGVWVERTERRRLMIACDIVRALALATVPITLAAGALTVAHLVIVALIIGTGSVLYDVANQTYLPSVVPAQDLVSSNSKLQASQSAAQTAGPALSGVIVQFIGAALSLLIDVGTYVLSALMLLRVRHREAAPQRNPSERMLPQIREGLRYVWNDPVFRPLLIVVTGLNLFGSAFDTLLIPFLLRDMKMPPAQIGALLALAGVGALLGAAFGPLLTRKVGSARAIMIAAVVGPWLGLLVPASRVGWGLGFFVIGLVGREAGIAMYSLLARSFRQMTAPRHLLARITATVRFVSWGVLPIGAVGGGALGQLMGIRSAIWVICIALLFTPLPLMLLSVRKLQQLIDEGSATGGAASPRTASVHSVSGNGDKR